MSKSSEPHIDPTAAGQEFSYPVWLCRGFGGLVTLLVRYLDHGAQVPPSWLDQARHEAEELAAAIDRHKKKWGL